MEEQGHIQLHIQAWLSVESTAAFISIFYLGKDKNRSSWT